MAETVKFNPYGYAGDDPVNLVDPSGKAPNPIDDFEGCVHSAVSTLLGDISTIVGGFAGSWGGATAFSALQGGASVAEAVSAVPFWTLIVAGVAGTVLAGIGSWCAGGAAADAVLNVISWF